MVQFKAALIWCTVLLIRLFTVVTDSGLIRATGELLTSIWNTTVISEPDDRFPASAFELVEAMSLPPPLLPSGMIVNPDGSKGM